MGTYNTVFSEQLLENKSIQYRKKIILVDCKNHDTHDELDLSKSGKYKLQ